MLYYLDSLNMFVSVITHNKNEKAKVGYEKSEKAKVI